MTGKLLQHRRSRSSVLFAAELTDEKELEKKKDDEAVRLRALKPTETAEGGYSLNEALKVGMKMTYTHELYTAT